MRLINDPFEWTRVNREERETPEGYYRREASLWKFSAFSVTVLLVLTIVCMGAYGEGRLATAQEIKTIASEEVKRQLDDRITKVEISLSAVENKLGEQQADVQDIKSMVRAIRK